MTPRRFIQRRGFTFLELMVSMALILVLMALLSPMLMRGRDSARRASCMSNLSQLGGALHLYAQDYDGRLPAAPNDWTVTADVYSKNTGIYVCPEEPAASRARFEPGVTARGPSGQRQLSSSYSYRAGFCNDDPAEEPVSSDWSPWHSDGLNVLYLGGNVRWKPAREAPTLATGPRPALTGERVAGATRISD
jgi:prepilin-type N-terminal cleavage/methylation domain-containing protein/prepilin-type processing-associated H-X9-DG protein